MDLVVGMRRLRALFSDRRVHQPRAGPRQAVDRRADIWAFGCVLYEMLTGRQVFGTSQTVSDAIASVLLREPEWSALPTATPSSIRTLLQRCLRKEAQERLPHISAVRFEIEDALATPASGARSLPQSGSWSTVVVAIASAAVAAIAVGVAVWMVATNSTTSSTAQVVRFAIHDTDKFIVSRTEGDMALSPDGRTLAFVAFSDGGPRVWVRALDALEAHSLPGTEGAISICWSPDGRSLAFVSIGQLKTVALAGGSPEIVATGTRVGGAGSSLTWGQDGVLLYIDSRGLWKVQSSGSAPPTRLVAPSYDEVLSSAAFLPEGRRFLVAVRSADPAKAGTFLAALEEGTRTRVLPFPTVARYVAGRLLFVRDRRLYTQTLDLSRSQLPDDAVPLAENVASAFSVSNNGVVAYLPPSASGQSESLQLLWMDRTGRSLGQVDQAAGATRPVLSPDGRRLAMALRDDIWVLELARDVLSRLTSGGAGVPLWSADSQRVLFMRLAFRNGKDVIFERPVGSTSEATIVREPEGTHAHPTGMAADGQYLIYEGEEDATDVWGVQLTGDCKARAYVQSPSFETQGALSADGHWLAYTSDVSGRFEVYVQSFPEPGSRIQVSASGGSAARWRRDGKELFYLALDGTLMAVPVRAGQPLEFGSPVSLFQSLRRIGDSRRRRSYRTTSRQTVNGSSSALSRVGPIRPSMCS